MTDTTELTDAQLNARVATIEEWVGEVPDFCNDVDAILRLCSSVRWQINHDPNGYVPAWGEPKYQCQLYIFSSIVGTGSAEYLANAIVLAYLDWKEREDA